MSTQLALLKAVFYLILFQRSQADLFIVLHSICNDVRPSTLPILSSTAVGSRLRRNIDIHIVFRVRELARILKLKCRATQ